MATIVNTRDIILQAAGTRILNVSLPSNITSIPNSVTVTGGYGSLGTIANNASNAVSQLSTKLSKSSSDILSGAISVTTSGGFKAGTLTWDSAGNITGGSGVAMTAKGIIGASSGTPTFTIDTNGNASYLGTISAAQVTTGTLTSVIVDTSGYVRAYGTYTAGVTLANGSTVYPTIYGRTAASSSDRPAVLAEATAASGKGLYAISTSGDAVYSFSSSGAGVYSQSTTGTAVFGLGGSATGIGIYAQNTFGGTALYVNGPMTITSTTVVGNLNADRVDNYHAGNSSGQIAVSNGSTCTSLNADMLDGYHESSFVKIAPGRSNNDYLSYVGTAATAGANLGYIILQNNAGTQVKVPLYAM